MIEFEQGRRSCPVCGSTDARVFVEARFEQSELDSMSFSSRKVPEGLYHRLLECASCDLLYASPVPDVRVADRRVSPGGATRAARRRGTQRRRTGRSSSRSPRSFPTFGARRTSARGTARFWSGCVRQGSRRRRLRALRGAARGGAGELRDAIRPEPFSAGVLPDESFTLISCMQTIEHVLDPLEVCRDAVRALAPTGRVLIACHDRRAFTARVLKQRSPIFDIEHVQLFSPAEHARAAPPAQASSAWTCDRCEIATRSGTGSSCADPESLRTRAAANASAGRVIDRPVSLGVGNLVAVGYKPAA